MQDHHRTAIRQHLGELVDQTSPAQLQNIIEYFIRKKLLNDHMVNKIQNIESPSEKCKYFYEMVTKRGPDAFRTLVEALNYVNLHDLGKTLESNRLFIRVQPEETDAVCNGIESDGLRWGKRVNTPDNRTDKIYELKSNPKGYVLIINIKTYIGFPHEKRHGSQYDVKRIEKEWKKRGFYVISCENLTKSECERRITDFTQMKELKKADSAFVFIMTHGKVNEMNPRRLLLHMHDWSQVDSEWILEQFNTVNCKNLAGKPKVIVFQACRGDNKDKGVSIQTDGFNANTQPFLSGIQRIPTISDLLVVYSTLPGYVAERDVSSGSFFIQLWCDVLKENSQEDILHMLNEVSRRLRVKYENNEMQSAQGVHWENLRFDKTFYL